MPAGLTRRLSLPREGPGLPVPEHRRSRIALALRAVASSGGNHVTAHAKCRACRQARHQRQRSIRAQLRQRSRQPIRRFRRCTTAARGRRRRSSRCWHPVGIGLMILVFTHGEPTDGAVPGCGQEPSRAVSPGVASPAVIAKPLPAVLHHATWARLWMRRDLGAVGARRWRA
jgi:hypothetical protein